MASTSSSVVLGSKSQFQEQRAGCVGAAVARESDLNGDVRAQAVWRTGREYPAHAFDGLGHAVAVAEDGDEAPQVFGRTARVVAGDESPHPGLGPACQVGLRSVVRPVRRPGSRAVSSMTPVQLDCAYSMQLDGMVKARAEKENLRHLALMARETMNRRGAELSMPADGARLWISSDLHFDDERIRKHAVSTVV